LRSIWLDISRKAHFIHLFQEWSFDDELVLDIVGEFEPKEEPSTNDSDLKLIESSVSEEVRSISEIEQVGEASTCVVLHGLGSEDGVESVVFGLSQFGVEHQVSHGVVRISMEVAGNIVSSIVEGAVLVCSVSLQLVGINKMINEFEHGLFEAGDLLGTWLDIEREIVESLDAQESVVAIEEGLKDRAFLHVTPHCSPIEHVLLFK
jgi:hypothetical protein